ncbi:response regulator [Sulfurimonas sp. ST-27]|uniref:response regulator n=1 Tax=Sulfurimonas sp. ST-27 TaxID=3400152 RepID=UPI003AB51AAC
MLYCDDIYHTIDEKVEYNILIVEDSEMFNKAISSELSKNKNFKSKQAYTLNDAQNLLQEDHFDFIILDLNLPDAFGEELVDAIKQISQAKLIILTAEVDVQIRETLFKKGILDYLVKDKTFSYSLKSIAKIIENVELNKKDTILVIDDSKFMCKQLETLLHVKNYNVLTALNAKEGLEILYSNSISTLILDMELPDKHGLELLQELKVTTEYCHLPVIILSASNDPEVVRSALKLGASDFIKKPFNIEEFTLKVDLSVTTYRKRVQLLCSQQMVSEYKEIVDESSLVTKTDTKGIITYANDEFCRVSGYTQEELIGKPHNIVRHPDMSAEVFKTMWKTILAKKTWKGVIKNRTKMGHPYYVKSTIKPILDINGDIVEFISIRTDISELEAYKELLEENLEISGNNLNYLKQHEDATNSFISVMKTNKSGKIIYVNDNFLQLSGYSKNELYGKECKSIRAIKHIKQGDCDKLHKQLQDKKTVSFLFENIDKDGNSFYTDTFISPLIDKNRVIQEYVHLMHNVTEVVKVHQELEETQKEIIYTMGEIGESRSQETGNHVKRVAEYSKLLALLAGLGEKNANLLFIASPMHDIGKVAIPDAILNKPGRHTSEEFEIMKTHAEIGFNILKASKRPTLRAAAVVAYTHHEKWDGSGYPRGKKGNEIHIFGRITAIADVFDALGSDRVYKKAWELEKILALFKEEKGKHFDPKLVDLFFDNLDKFLAIRDKFKD